MLCFNKDSFKTAFPWILLTVGVILFALWLWVVPPESILGRASLEVADILLIGVLVGFLTKASTFTKAVEKELGDIIYGKKFIKKRNDISEVWKNISKLMFKNKFPGVNDALLKAIQKYLPDNKTVSYYEDYEVDTQIEWVNKDKNLIKVTDKIFFDLKADSEKRFIYPLKTWTTIKNENHYENNIEKILINGSVPKTEVHDFDEGGDKCQEVDVTLEGSKKYKVYYKRVKVYSLSGDNYIGFRALYIVKGLTVTLNYPEGIEAEFICRGTQEDFEDIPKCGRCIEKKYKEDKGLILPRQGYIFVLQKCN